jgi:hypothetical protein
MNATGDTGTAREVWRFIQDFNRTWTEGDPKDLRSLFDPNMVIIHPGFGGRTVGRDAAVASYVDFCLHAKVLSFSERDPDIDVNENVAIVSYTFDIGYELNGARHHEQGRDLFVLRRDNKRWRVLWRTLLPEVVE